MNQANFEQAYNEGYADGRKSLGAHHMFTEQNTSGYTAAQLAVLNATLVRRLAGVEPGSDEAMQIEKAFYDEVGHADTGSNQP
jgi:hypothetical protein